jgi:hypothetical protein
LHGGFVSWIHKEGTSQFGLPQAHFRLSSHPTQFDMTHSSANDIVPCPQAHHAGQRPRHQAQKPVASFRSSGRIAAMSNKQIVADLMEKLPNDASLTDIAREIEFIAGVREGFAQLDRGEGVPLEEVEKQLPSWISK